MVSDLVVFASSDFAARQRVSAAFCASDGATISAEVAFSPLHVQDSELIVVASLQEDWEGLDIDRLELAKEGLLADGRHIVKEMLLASVLGGAGAFCVHLDEVVHLAEHAVRLSTAGSGVHLSKYSVHPTLEMFLKAKLDVEGLLVTLWEVVGKGAEEKA